MRKWVVPIFCEGDDERLIVQWSRAKVKATLNVQPLSIAVWFGFLKGHLQKLKSPRILTSLVKLKQRCSRMLLSMAFGPISIHILDAGHRLEYKKSMVN